MAKFNDKISTLINSQLPDFVVDDHPQFAQFIKTYFTFMESAMLQVDGIESTDGITLENETGRTDNLLLDGSKISFVSNVNGRGEGINAFKIKALAKDTIMKKAEEMNLIQNQEIVLGGVKIILD